MAKNITKICHYIVQIGIHTKLYFRNNFFCFSRFHFFFCSYNFVVDIFEQFSAFRYFSPRILNIFALKIFDHSLCQMGRVNLFEPSCFPIPNLNDSVLDCRGWDDNDKGNAELICKLVQLLDGDTLFRHSDLNIFLL